MGQRIDCPREAEHTMKQILNRQEVEDVLRKYIRKQGWAMLDCRISNFDSFRVVYGFAASEEVLHFTAKLIEEVIDEIGTPDDQVGNTEADNFVILTTATAASKMRERLKSRFNAEVIAFYSLADRERGYLIVQDENSNETRLPMMSLVVGKLIADDLSRGKIDDYRRS